jgi:hypothetical protein
MVLTISVTKMLPIVVSLSGLHVQAASKHFLQPEKAKQKFANTYFFIFFFLNLYIQNEFSDPIIYDRRKL